MLHAIRHAPPPTKMTDNAFSREELLSHLSHRPRYILNGVISVDESAKPSFPEIRRKCQSSMGFLDHLPLELLHETLNYLDLQSLSRLSRVSLYGKSVVEKLPAYRDLFLSAGHVLVALNRTKVIGFHSAATLHAALYSHRCASCGNYGAFLFLLSAERCCFACLSRNQSLWMIPRALARDCFCLTQEDLKTLPTIRSIPGTYFVRHRISRQRITRLTSAKAAKELALKVHGSTEAMARNLAAKHLCTTDIQFYTAKWLQDAPLQPLSKDPLTLEFASNTPDDKFCGMGSVPFPSMSGNRVENGLWCRGCERNFELFRGRKLDRGVVSRLVPLGCDPFQFMMGMQYYARSKVDFLEHAKHCHSAREVITKRWIGLM